MTLKPKPKSLRYLALGWNLGMHLKCNKTGELNLTFCTLAMAHIQLFNTWHWITCCSLTQLLHTTICSQWQLVFQHSSSSCRSHVDIMRPPNRKVTWQVIEELFVRVYSPLLLLAFVSINCLWWIHFNFIPYFHINILVSWTVYIFS